MSVLAFRGDIDQKGLFINMKPSTSTWLKDLLENAESFGSRKDEIDISSIQANWVGNCGGSRTADVVPKGDGSG